MEELSEKATTILHNENFFESFGEIRLSLKKTSRKYWSAY